MNIFFLSNDTDVAASAMTDKHIVKMVLETAQILSTVHQVNSKEPIEYLYKPTHTNHPSVKWARESVSNYIWLYKFFISMSLEYTIRFKKIHKSFSTLHKYLKDSPKGMVDVGFTEMPQAMPDIYKRKSSIEAYRLYYENEKLKTDKDKERYYGIFNSVIDSRFPR